VCVCLNVGCAALIYSNGPRNIRLSFLSAFEPIPIVLTTEEMYEDWNDACNVRSICLYFCFCRHIEVRKAPCSVSSLESCGAISGPLASSGRSQLPSPPRTIPSYAIDTSRGGLKSSAAGQSASHGRGPEARCTSISLPDDVGYIRIPVINQVHWSTFLLCATCLSSCFRGKVSGDKIHAASHPTSFPQTFTDLFSKCHKVHFTDSFVL
jgi:hypothetical protein